MPFDPTQDGPQIMPRRTKWLAAGMIAAAAVAVAACFAKRPAAVDPPDEQAKPNDQLFRNWPKPDLIVMISGQQHGYLDPCGCSRPQIGGLVRRYNFLQTLKDRGWPILAVDVGDIAQKETPAKLPNLQGLIKYKYSMEALKILGYSAVTVGEYEASLELDKVLGIYALNNPVPKVLIANLKDRDVNFPEEQAAWMVETVKGSPLKVGIIGVVGASSAKKMMALQERGVEFPEGSAAKAIETALKEMDAKNKPDLRILLYQGQPDEARACANFFPNRFQMIACVSTFDEPPSNSEIVKEAGTMIVTVGHKGKYVGAVGINRTEKNDPKFELRYQLVRLGEEFLTPKDKENDQPIMRLMEQYTKELKRDRDKYLAKYFTQKHPIQLDKKPEEKPVFVGTERCMKCHDYAYDIWKQSGHAHAYSSLIDADKKNPPVNRQYDGECVVCHTVGFVYDSGFRNEKDTPKLINVGCESCHGPGSQHAKHHDNVQLRAEMNPLKGNARRIEDSCIKCHDPENDVHWNFDKWKKIVHMTPKDQ
jgi:hypothetical protein